MQSILWIIRLLVDSASAFFSGKKAGREERDAEIEEETKSAREKARLANLSVRECHAAGGKWNQRTGKCEF